MKLYEYLAKEVMGKHGVPIPRGRVAASPEEAEKIAAELGEVAIKVQVLAGGRGKAGGIAFAATPQEARDHAARLLGIQIRGLQVDRVLVEEKLKIDRELYLGLTVDTSARVPLVMASTEGGVNIEEVPEKYIIKQHLDVHMGLYPFHGRQLARRLGLTGSLARQFADTAVRLYQVFREYDAELVEVNPLVVSGDRLVAADGRLNIDDDALYRHPQVPRTHEGTELELRVKELGLAFVQLDGDIAVMANGAGITMAVLDILASYGGKAANFLDAGGGAAIEPTARAIEVLLATNPRAILVNIFGGITRCDDVARALIQVKNTRGIPVPLVIRLVGTNEEAALSILRESGLTAFRSMRDAAAEVVRISHGPGGEL